MDGGGKELRGIAVELFDLGAFISELIACDRIQVFLVEGLCHFQFSGVLVLDGFLKDFDHSNDPVVGRTGEFDRRDLQIVCEVADVTVVCRSCAVDAVRS